MRRDSHRAIATDSEGHELRVNDNVKEIDGEVSMMCVGRLWKLTYFKGSKRTRVAYISVVLRFPH